MGIAQASEQAFLSKTQSSRIIKMVKFFTQMGVRFTKMEPTNGC